jgi:hypothetical protein
MDVVPVNVANAVPIGDSTPRLAVPLTVLVRVRVTTPATVVADPVTEPKEAFNFTVVPSGTRFPMASLTVMVNVEKSTPSATIVVLDATILACAGGPGFNTTVVFPVTVASVVPDGS